LLILVVIIRQCFTFTDASSSDWPTANASIKSLSFMAIASSTPDLSTGCFISSNLFISYGYIQRTDAHINAFVYSSGWNNHQ
jgi:hypothetical protein